MRRSALLRIAALAGLVALAGCDSMDPYMRTDVWKPNGANAGNIAAMVADPHDLISGHGAIFHDANAPALAIGHVWTDQPKSLTPAAGGGGGASGSGAGGSGAGAGGGGSGSGSGGAGS